MELSPESFEVIFVDDCSSDGTSEYLKEECVSHKNWRFFQLNKNSGSPSKPRNKGVEKAQGEYVYFLDCDDEILPGAFDQLYDLAVKANACLVRSELLAEDGDNRRIMNQLADWHPELKLRERIELIISKQSTVVASFVKRSLLIDHAIKWPEHLRMGEDTVFLAKVLSVSKIVEYLNVPTFVYFKLPSLTPASTQQYGKRELLDHVEVWKTTQQILLSTGVDYIKKRLNIGIKVALEALISKNRGDVDEDSFNVFNEFVEVHWSFLGTVALSKRLKGLLAAVHQGNYVMFQELAKPRLLIAGHDLKFIKDAVPELERHYHVKFDEWNGHAIHDEKESLECLEWAECIWCEWLLGNAEWYARHKRPHQRLVVRMHRMELARNHGAVMNIDNVDAVVAVSVYFFERLLEKYPNIPRHKARLVHNYVRVDDYDTTWHPDRLFTIGIIGTLPSRKGYKKALEILYKLRSQDVRFNLKVFGKRAEELSWVAGDPVEMSYFADCQSYIKKNNLTDSVDFVGHVDIKKELAQQQVGFVLSVSDPDLEFPGPESFHLAIADGFAGGGVSLVQHWPGCDYIWPESSIFKNKEEIVAEIINLANEKVSFSEKSSAGRRFIKNRFDVESFAVKIKDIFSEIA
jgi:glycosyltransferase involved in cell wall biosynthesis